MPRAYNIHDEAQLLARASARQCRDFLKQLPYHRHVHLVCGRAKDAAIYPEPVCQSILQGILAQKMADSTGVVPITEVSLLNLGVGEVQDLRA